MQQLTSAENISDTPLATKITDPQKLTNVVNSFDPGSQVEVGELEAGDVTVGAYNSQSKFPGPGGHQPG